MNILEAIKTEGYVAYSVIAELMSRFSDSDATVTVIKDSVKGLFVGAVVAICMGISVLAIECIIEFLSERRISDPNHADSVLVKRRFSFRWVSEENRE